MSTPRHTLPLLVLAFVSILFVPLALAGPDEDARRAAEERDWARAAESWQRVLAAKPGDAEAAVGLARAVVEGWLVDLYPRAEDALHAVLDARPDDRKVRLALGDLYIALAQSKTDATAMKFTYEDAKTQFGKLVEADPNDEEAVVGLARAHWWTAFFDEAEAVLDRFLGKAESKGPALFWRGQVLYTRATDAFRSAGSRLDDAGRALFEKARSAYEEATKRDPALFDGWLQLGYAAQYLGDLDGAQAAYERAMEIDGESDRPLKGIEALYFHRQDRYVPALKSLVLAHPTNAMVHFFLGFRQLHEKDYDGAVESFKTYLVRSQRPGNVWTHLGRAYAGRGDAALAREAFEKALGVNPADEVAADGIDRQIQAAHAEQAAESPSGSQAAVKAYAGLFELAPANPWTRNNAAFMLRGALDRHAGDPAWKPVLEECARLYEEGSRLVEEEVRGREATLPADRLFKMAGVLNDTGLMYQYYPAIRDPAKAEEYYLRSLELSRDTYGDAFGNLVQLYLEQERWQEAYDLARDCGEIAKNPEGNPSPQYRAAAAQIMEKLVREGKAE